MTEKSIEMAARALSKFYGWEPDSEYEGRPAYMDCLEEAKIALDAAGGGSFKIGKFTLSLLEFDDRPNSIWIQTESGEAGEFKLDQFEQAVAYFYEENF